MSLDGFEAEFEKKLPIYEALASEVKFIIDGILAGAGVKIHGTEHRVKDASSIRRKCESRGLDDPFVQLKDIVGLRVICLFREDIEQVSSLIRENFSVIEEDNKLELSEDTFGYMSLHFICSLKEEYSGFRYEKIKGIKFEIQVRTLCMHAWAVVSHYLDYKGAWDVPAELKRSLNALSALFYVADNQFGLVYRAKEDSKASAIEAPERQLREREINLDTIAAYGNAKFSDRNPIEGDQWSKLVWELKSAGYKSIEEVDRDINRASDALVLYEKETFKNNKAFASLGAARVSIALASQRFREIAYEHKVYHSRFQKYEIMVKP